MSDAAPAPTLVLGRCDEMRAEVFLRAAAAGSAVISGTVAGPQRGRDTTLPATARIQPMATPGVARAVVTEPAYWTPDLPNLYRLRARVEAPGVPSLAIDRLIGLRRLGVRRKSLWLDGHRWVPRAVRAEGTAGIDACKPALLAALVDDPDEATLARADAIGVAVLAVVPASLAGDPNATATRIASWAAHPSTAVAILPTELPSTQTAAIASAVRQHKDTLLLAATVSGAQRAPETIPPGIDALVVDIDDDVMLHESWRSGVALPLLARRRASAAPVPGRGPCDALQAALAAWGTAGGRDTLAWDWAGYVIG